MSVSRFLAVVVTASAFLAPAAFAQQALTGSDAHRKLSGQNFEFTCVDGTRGNASYSGAGVATASYRVGGAPDDATVQTDRGHVRVDGEHLCIRWGKLNGGAEGCYRMTERRPGTYRIAEGSVRWCDITVRGSRSASN